MAWMYDDERCRCARCGRVMLWNWAGSVVSRDGEEAHYTCRRCVKEQFTIQPGGRTACVIRNAVPPGVRCVLPAG